MVLNKHENYLILTKKSLPQVSSGENPFQGFLCHKLEHEPVLPDF